MSVTIMYHILPAGWSAYQELEGTVYGVILDLLGDYMLCENVLKLIFIFFQISPSYSLILVFQYILLILYLFLLC